MSSQGLNDSVSEVGKGRFRPIAVYAVGRSLVCIRLVL